MGSAFCVSAEKGDGGGARGGDGVGATSGVGAPASIFGAASCPLSLSRLWWKRIWELLTAVTAAVTGFWTGFSGNVWNGIQISRVGAMPEQWCRWMSSCHDDWRYSCLKSSGIFGYSLNCSFLCTLFQKSFMSNTYRTSSCICYFLHQPQKLKAYLLFFLFVQQ